MAMNLLRQRLNSLRCRAVELQTCLRRWALYNDQVPHDWKAPLLDRMTPAEESAFQADLVLTRTRLRPVSAQIQTVMKWYEFVLEQVLARLDHAAALQEQARGHECVAALAELEARLIEPNEETLGFFCRCLAQHASHEYHQKLGAIDAILRSLYLPTVKMAHQRGLLPREALSRTPLAFVTDDAESIHSWRHHAMVSSRCGRQLPLSLVAIPRRRLAEPWNLVDLAFEVGRCLQDDLNLEREIAARIQSGAASGTGDSSLWPVSSRLWASWSNVVFADVFATIKLGPAYLSGTIEKWIASPATVAAFAPTSESPPPLIRWQVMIQALHLLNLADSASQWERTLRQTFGDFERYGASLGAAWGRWTMDCRAVAQLAAFTPLTALGMARLVDVAEPFLASDAQRGQRVREWLLASDASGSSEQDFRWIESGGDSRMTAHIALSGLRAAYDVACDAEAAGRLWIRFWRLMQHLATSCDAVREQEDHEFAPADNTLRQIAQQSMPVSHIPSRTMLGISPYAPGMEALTAIPNGVPGTIFSPSCGVVQPFASAMGRPHQPTPQ